MPESQQPVSSPLKTVSAALFQVGEVDLAASIHTIASQINMEEKSGRD